MSDSALIAPTGGSKVNEEKTFADAFGPDTPDKTVISDPLGAVTGEEGFDRRPAIRKSLDAEYRAIDEIMADGGSFRAAMHEVAAAKGLNVDDYTLPVYPLSDLTRLTSKKTPFWDMLPKMARNSNTVEQDSVTGLASPQIGGEREVPPDQDDDYQPQSLSMTYYRVTGSVSGPMNLASSGFRNAMGTEQTNKAEAMTHFSANLALNGDPTAGTADGTINDERAYKGIRTLVTDAGENREPSAGAGTPITSEMVRENFRRAVEDGGNANSTVHVTDWKTLTDLKNALDDHDPVIIQNGPQGSVNLGARGVMIDGQPLVASDFMPNADYDATANPGGRELLTVDMRFLGVHDLSSRVLEALGKRNDADEFFMKRYSVLMLAAGASKYSSLLTGLP